MNISDLIVLPAHPEDHTALTELTLKSKASWGYSSEQMLKWKEELTVTPEYIKTNSVYKAVSDKNLVGFYSFIPFDPETVELDFFFIHHSLKGKGIGKNLILDFIKRVHNLPATRIVVKADPNAEAFYIKAGFNTTDRIQSKIFDRELPFLEYWLTT